MKKLLGVLLALLMILSLVPDGSFKVNADDSVALLEPADRRVITYIFDPNGGSGQMDSVDFTLTPGTNYILPECTFAAPQGMVFVAWGWNDPTYNRDNLNYPGRPAGFPGGDQTSVTLYALWDLPSNLCEVVFDANGGTGSRPSMYCPWGYELPKWDGTGFTREGYVFSGWSTEKTTDYIPFDIQTPSQPTEDGKMTLYAQWTKIVNFIIEFGSSHKDFAESFAEMVEEATLTQSGSGVIMTVTSDSAQIGGLCMQLSFRIMDALIEINASESVMHNGEGFFMVLPYQSLSGFSDYGEIIASMSSQSTVEVQDGTVLYATWLKPITLPLALSLSEPECGNTFTQTMGDDGETLTVTGGPDISITSGGHYSISNKVISGIGEEMEVKDSAAASWIDDDGPIITEDNGQKFVGGQTYAAEIILSADVGYFFGSNEDVTVQINDEEVDWESYHDYMGMFTMNLLVGRIRAVASVTAVHDWQDEEPTETTATCIEPGSHFENQICPGCDQESVNEIDDDPLGHIWGDWEYNFEEGTKKRVCERNKDHFEIEDLETFTITFDLGGGTLNGQTGKITMDIVEGKEITIPDAPEKQGFKFLYWEGSRYNPGDEYQVTGEHTFTAVYKQLGPDTGDAGIDGYSYVMAGCMLAALACILKIRKNTVA